MWGELKASSVDSGTIVSGCSCKIKSCLIECGQSQKQLRYLFVYYGTAISDFVCTIHINERVGVQGWLSDEHVNNFNWFNERDNFEIDTSIYFIIIPEWNDRQVRRISGQSQSSDFQHYDWIRLWFDYIDVNSLLIHQKTQPYPFERERYRHCFQDWFPLNQFLPAFLHVQILLQSFPNFDTVIQHPHWHSQHSCVVYL